LFVMQAIVLREVGDPDRLRLEQLPDPQPGPGEALVRLRAAALNHRDVWIRRGQYAGIRLPIVLGSDGAGEVADVGPGVDRGLIGRAVIINPGLGWGTDERFQGPEWRILGLPEEGTYAELVKVPAAALFSKPEMLSFEDAAAIPLAALTAYRAVAVRARVQAEETVLVTGIGGGVAVFALQIARHLGARVAVTSSSDEKLQKARDIGADIVVNYRTSDWVAELKRQFKGGVDVVIDGAGGDTWVAAIDLAAPGGRVVNYGATAGPAKAVEVRRVFWKQLNLLGSTMGSPRDFAAMHRLFADGALQPVVDSVYPLAEASKAHDRMEKGEQFGKIVLAIA
jgi:NADPH:quinone reductase-like Zn-dependent oxidoreductase